MQQCSLVEKSSGSSFESGTFFKDSYFDGPTGNGIDLDTNLTDINAFADKDSKDEAWLFSNEGHLPEYYLQQLETFNKQEYAKEEYKDSSTRLLNCMKYQWNQYYSCSPYSLRWNAWTNPGIDAGHTKKKTTIVPMQLYLSLLYTCSWTGRCHRLCLMIRLCLV
jgi:hypothetical protein